MSEVPSAAVEVAIREVLIRHDCGAPWSVDSTAHAIYAAVEPAFRQATADEIAAEMKNDKLPASTITTRGQINAAEATRSRDIEIARRVGGGGGGGQ